MGQLLLRFQSLDAIHISSIQLCSLDALQTRSHFFENVDLVRELRQNFDRKPFHIARPYGAQT